MSAYTKIRRWFLVIGGPAALAVMGTAAVLLFVSQGSLAPDSIAVVGTSQPTSTRVLYQNDTFHFQLEYPRAGSLVETPDHANAVIELPLSGTPSVLEEYLLVNIVTSQAECDSPISRAYLYASGQYAGDWVSGSGLSFQKQDGASCGSDCSFWTSYSTAKGATCASLTFVRRVIWFHQYTTPEPTLTDDGQAKVFQQILASFKWR